MTSFDQGYYDVIMTGVTSTDVTSGLEVSDAKKTRRTSSGVK